MSMPAEKNSTVKIKIKKGESFVAIPERILTDSAISTHARLVLIYMIGKPDGWELHVWQIQRALGITQSGWQTARRQLQIRGYLNQTKQRAKNGDFFWEIEVTDSPAAAGDVTATTTCDVATATKTENLRSKDLLAQREPDQLRESKKGARLPDDWVLPKSWGEWALNERPDLQAEDIRKISEVFHDYWLANANQPSGKKANWQAAWRIWVRRESPTSQSQSHASKHRDYGTSGRL